MEYEHAAWQWPSRYERSYDVTLVRRSLAGKNFISLNIMWAYREQASFAVSHRPSTYLLWLLSRLTTASVCPRSCSLKPGAILQLTEEEHLNRLDYVAEALRCAGDTCGCSISWS